MAGYVIGSKEHFDKLIEVITESCDNLKNLSSENERDVQRIMDSISRIYLDYSTNLETTKRVNDIKRIDIPEFIK